MDSKVPMTADVRNNIWCGVDYSTKYTFFTNEHGEDNYMVECFGDSDMFFVHKSSNVDGYTTGYEKLNVHNDIAKEVFTKFEKNYMVKEEFKDVCKKIFLPKKYNEQLNRKNQVLYDDVMNIIKHNHKADEIEKSDEVKNIEVDVNNESV